MNVVELKEHDGTFSWEAKNDHGRVIARGGTDEYQSRAAALADMNKFVSDGYSVIESRQR